MRDDEGSSSRATRCVSYVGFAVTPTTKITRRARYFRGQAVGWGKIGRDASLRLTQGGREGRSGRRSHAPVVLAQ